MRQQQQSKLHQSTSTTTTNQTLLLLQHPSHHHPSELRDLSNETRPLRCYICHKKISAEAYTWQEGCKTYSNICGVSVEVDGYMCMHRSCEFVIFHKRCIQDLYYADGTKAPRVCHVHPLETLIGEYTNSTICASCGSDKSGEFIGCASCEALYHRHCFQVPEILRYPSHNPDHTLVLFPEIGTQGRCQSCSRSFEKEIYYRCTSCEFSVHIECAFQVLAYCDKGMSTKIELSWHKHPLLLRHRAPSPWYSCSYCKDTLFGPTYECEEKDCRFRLHKRCTEIESTITHNHHPDHLLTLCGGDDEDVSYLCKACGRTSRGLKFSCERCLVDLDVKCAARLPTHKHYLHEHKLLRFKEYNDLECNRCSRSTDLPLFRCVPCDFNLHEECMELPQVVKSKIHWHPLTLHETFLEDDSGEYKISMPRIYHIECALPEIRKVYEKKLLLPPAVEKLNKQISDKRKEVFTIKEEVHTMKEEVRTKEEQLKGATRELDELVKQRDALLKGESEDES